MAANQHDSVGLLLSGSTDEVQRRLKEAQKQKTSNYAMELKQQIKEREDQRVAEKIKAHQPSPSLSTDASCTQGARPPSRSSPAKESKESTPKSLHIPTPAGTGIPWGCGGLSGPKEGDTRLAYRDLSDTEESHDFIPQNTSRAAYVDRLELEAQMKAQADLRAKERSESIEEDRRLTALVVPVERSDQLLGSARAVTQAAAATRSRSSTQAASLNAGSHAQESFTEIRFRSDRAFESAEQAKQRLAKAKEHQRELERQIEERKARKAEEERHAKKLEEEDEQRVLKERDSIARVAASGHWPKTEALTQTAVGRNLKGAALEKQTVFASKSQGKLDAESGNACPHDLEDNQGESERRGGSRSGVQTAADELAALKGDMVAEAARVKALLDAQQAEIARLRRMTLAAGRQQPLADEDPPLESRQSVGDADDLQFDSTMVYPAD